ncbi:MAG: MATE family efflux transporter [Gemmatimonadetes bacterium]|nr:MATE family efflux transporter [Gemmatimonadota bacterium]
MAAPAPRKLDRSIVEGPIPAAVWRIAWPTMVQNMIGGLQGVIDHAMVGQFVGFAANAGIGVSWQIFLVVMVFVSSLFTGMGVLAARFAGAGDLKMVNETVYQAFITAAALSFLVLAPVGYFATPWLLGLVNATEAVRHEATPFLRIMFTCSVGMMLFFMLGGAMRAAGDAKTPLRLGVTMTVLNICLNVVLIPGIGPIPRLGTTGAAMGTTIASASVGLFAVRQLFTGAWVISFKGLPSYKPDWEIIRQLFKFGLPTGVQGVAMNVAGVLLLRFIGSLTLSAESQAAWTVSYTELFSFITWTSVGLMGAAATVAGQNLGAGHPDRAAGAAAAAARIGIFVAAFFGALYLIMPRVLLSVFGMRTGIQSDIAVELLRYLALSGFFITVALSYTGALQRTGDTRSPLVISIISQIIVPLGTCFVIQETGTLQPHHIWTAVVCGHLTRAVLSVTRFRQGKWRAIEVKLHSSAA